MKIRGCNCWQWPGLAGRKRTLLSTSMFGSWLCIYWPSYLHYQHAPCDSYNPHNCQLYRIPVFIAIIAFSRWIVNVCQEAHVSLVLPHHSCHVPPGPYLNVTRVSVSVSWVWGPRACPFYVVSQSHNKKFFSGPRSGEEKKLSIYSLWPNPSTPLVRLITVVWLAVRCCAALWVFTEVNIHVICVSSRVA